MENVRIAILNKENDAVLGFLDNLADKTLHYYNDELHEYLEGSTYTYQFKTFAKHEDSRYLVEGNKLSFVYNGKSYYLNIMQVIKGEFEVEVMAYGLTLELINEYVDAYDATKAMSFVEYMKAYGFADVIEIGVNEVSDKRITNEWQGQSTILARLFSLANVFDAELEFVPVLNKDYSLKIIRLNIYKQHDADKDVQGIGQRRTDLSLRYGLNIEGVTKTSDITGLYTAIRPTGRDGLTIKDVEATVKDDDGNVLYYTKKGSIDIRAEQAMQQFPSHSLPIASDKYMVQMWTYDTDNPQTLYGRALAQLKKNCVPQVTYDIKGYFDTGIGDTVRIVDEEYNPPLYAEARVTEQIRSFTDPTRNKTTFSNIIEKESQINAELLKQMQELVDASKTRMQEAVEEVQTIAVEAKSIANAAQSTATEAQNDIVSVGADVKIVENAVDACNVSVTSTKQELTEYKSAVERYIRFTDDGLNLGSTGSPFNTLIDENGMYFRQNDAVAAYITNSQLNIPDAIVTGALRLGDYLLVPGTDGSLSIVYQGDD